jgi:hypothetical protein
MGSQKCNNKVLSPAQMKEAVAMAAEKNPNTSLALFYQQSTTDRIKNSN